jgi:hypothetical protein
LIQQVNALCERWTPNRPPAAQVAKRPSAECMPHSVVSEVGRRCAPKDL